MFCCYLNKLNRFALKTEIMCIMVKGRSTLKPKTNFKEWDKQLKKLRDNQY